MNDTNTKPQLDLGKVLTAPFKDKQWFVKSLLMGLMMLIPIAGALNLSGWMRAIAERRMQGGPDADVLPEANLDYIGSGWRVFCAYLPIIGLFLLVLTVGATVVGISVNMGGKGSAGETIGMIIGVGLYLALIFGSLAISVISPAINFLHIVDGEAWASGQFRRIWETMKLGGVQYLLFFLAVFLAGMIAQLGVLACYVGMFVTLPLAQAMTGAAIADYARVVQPPKPGYPLEGGAGGQSGQPFGIKL